MNWNGNSVLIPILKGFNTGVVIYDLERLREINHLREYLSPEYIKYLVNKYMFFGTVGDQVHKYIVSILTRTNNWRTRLCPMKKMIIWNLKKIGKKSVFFCLCHSGLPMSVHKNFSPFGPAVWPAIGNIYTNVLFFYCNINWLLSKSRFSNILFKGFLHYVGMGASWTILFSTLLSQLPNLFRKGEG